MARKFSELRARMTPEARRESAEIAAAFRADCRCTNASGHCRCKCRRTWDQVGAGMRARAWRSSAKSSVIYVPSYNCSNTPATLSTDLRVGDAHNWRVFLL